LALYCAGLAVVIISCSPSARAALDVPNISTKGESANTASSSNGTLDGQNLHLLLAKDVDQKTFHRVFSLRACFDKADAENKEIMVATSSLPIAQAAIVIAKAIPNPTYSMMYGFSNSYSFIIAGNGQQFGWSEEIQVAGRRTKKSDLAHANYFQTALQVEAVRFDVHNRTRRAYAQVSADHAYLDVIEAQREIARKLLDISQKRFDAGKAPGSEVLQAKLGLMQFDTQENQAWGNVVQDSAQLALMLGEAPHSQEIIDVDENGLFKLTTEKSGLVPDPNRGTPPLEQLLPVAWRQRNDLKVAIQSAYADRKALTLAKTQRIPDPTVGFQYFFSTYAPYQFGYFDPAGVLPYLQSIYPNVPQLVPSFNNPNPPTDLVKNLYNESIVSGAGAKSGQAIPNIGKDETPFQPGYQAIVQQETPIFYQYQGEISQAKATWIQQLKQNEQLRAQIASDIVTAYESVLVTRANIKKFQDQVLPAAARVAQLTRRGYELGKMDLATTMLAQQQYQQLLSSYFDAVVAYQNAWSGLEKAVGIPLNL
jgi:outer membrane protein TolC